MRDKPNTTTSRAELGRGISVFINTDNNYTTGSYGADFALSLDFCTGSYNGTGKSSVAWYYKWTGTGMGKLQEKGVLTNSSDFNNVFELKIPLSVLNVNTGQTIGIYIYAYRTIQFISYCSIHIQLFDVPVGYNSTSYSNCFSTYTSISFKNLRLRLHGVHVLSD